MSVGELRRSIRKITFLSACLGIAALTGCALQKGLASPNDPARWPLADARQESELARLGKKLFDRTPKFARSYVGNQLACSDCHLNSGKEDYAAPMIDVAGLFPMFSKRAGHVITLEDRINECFVRSEAGRPLPHSSQQMQALVAYIKSLSSNQVQGQAYAKRGLVKLPVLQGDPQRGQIVYRQCALCHGDDGAGLPSAIPPLWGRGSFNDGAGMNDPAKMAAYVYANMPQNSPGTLSAQDALDVAMYIRQKPRPKLNPAYANF